MLDQPLKLFDIKADYDLNIMKQGQDLFDITTSVLVGMRIVLKESKPDLVFVHGDTTTSTFSALASFYEQIPIAHVEAGLRTHNINSPWPEEMNRQLTSRLATFNFAPTTLNRKNLLSELIDEKSIIVTGNTVIDALGIIIERINSDQVIREEIISSLLELGFTKTKIESWGKRNKMILITGHRRENFGFRFLNICSAIRDLAIAHPDIDFVYPMHLNQNVRMPIKQIFGDKNKERYPNIYFVEPLDYLPFIFLMNLAYFVLTDSGGVQEEAPGLGKPVLVMRDTTERPEAISAGTALLVGTEKDRIITGVNSLLSDNQLYERMSKANSPFGDGLASKRIVDFIITKLNHGL